jgi:hypothetical protein
MVDFISAQNAMLTGKSKSDLRMKYHPMKLKPLLKQQLSRACQMANKNIMVGILLAAKALLKSPYVKRYAIKDCCEFKV